MDLEATPVKTLVGRQLTASLSACSRSVLEDQSGLEEALRAASEAVGATVLQLATHRFSPQGITSVAILSESHAVLHTWPEHRSLTFDLFTCAGPDDIRVALEPLVRAFEPGDVTSEVTARIVVAAGKPTEHVAIDGGAQ